MKSLSILTFLLIVLVASAVEANELTSFEPSPAQEEMLQNVPDSNPESLGLPIYPNAKAITGNALMQGSFEARTFVFSIPAGFEKILNFYKDCLGKNVQLTVTREGEKQKAHFYFIAGSESRNVMLEEISKQETRLVLVVFEGGGDTLHE